jgi:tripartite-type tricarboxylate transporter receptor subunit TctC
VQKLNAAANEVMQSPEAQTGLGSLGGLPRLGSPEAFSTFIASEAEKWSAIIRTAGIQLDSP